MERFGEKSAENILDEVEQKKKIPIQRFVFALGILHVGEETARLLAQKAVSIRPRIKSPRELLEIFEKMSLNQLQEVPDIGPAVAQSIYDYFRDKHHRDLVKKLDKVGIELEVGESKPKSSKLRATIFVLTGSLETMSRDEARQKIRDLGGEISESVSKKTSYVVAGAEPGSKLEKAQKLGVKTINERELLNILT